MDLNRATILGRLTRDPEVKTTTTGKTVATMSVATNRTWTDQSGVKKELVEYHNCVLWGKLAEIAGQYMSKGKRAYVEGRIQTRDWVGDDGKKRYRTEIVVDNMIMLDGGSRASGTGASPSPEFKPAKSNEPSFTQEEAVIDEEVKVEDIPF